MSISFLFWVCSKLFYSCLFVQNHNLSSRTKWSVQQATQIYYLFPKSCLHNLIRKWYLCFLWYWMTGDTGWGVVIVSYRRVMNISLRNLLSGCGPISNDGYRRIVSLLYRNRIDNVMSDLCRPRILNCVQCMRSQYSQC